MRSTFLVILLLASLVPALYAAVTCPNGKSPMYRLVIIDANVTTPGCTYKVNVTKGNCAFSTDERKETSPKYVCFNQESKDCQSFEGMWPYSLVKCGDNMDTHALNYGAHFPTNQEFNMTSPMMTVRAFMGTYCDGVPTVKPRVCAGVSFGAGLQAGVAFVIMAVIGLFALL